MKRLTFFILSSLLSVACYGLPAKQGLLKALQPDGTTVNIYMEGDSDNKRMLSEDGLPLTTDEEGYYVFADLDNEGEVIPSSIRAINVDQRNYEIKERISRLNHREDKASYKIKEKKEDFSGLTRGIGLGFTKFPSSGEHQSLVILVEFSDNNFTIENPKEFYTRILNEPGFCDYGANGSARDFFISNSNGIFVPQFDVYGPVKLDKPYSYYGRNNMWGNDSYPFEMVVEACELLDEEIDFSQYDRDEDGLIDNIYIFYAGYGEADGGGADTIWPHSWDLTEISRYPYIFDGVRVDHYACSNEIQVLTDGPDGIGTFCHEFSHVLGLPDLYSTVYNSAFTPNSWDLLDHGSYNNYSWTPPNYSAFERLALDWINPEILSEGELTLYPIDESNEAFIAWTEKDNEYFLFENRQQQGFDEFLPGHGMLIWHIDFDFRKWVNNTVNNTATHQNVDIIEADNKRSQFNLDGDPFPGISNVTEFSCQTKPSFVSWGKVNMPLRLFDISESEDGIISFSVEECENAGIEDLVNNQDLLSIEDNMVTSGDQEIDIFKINGVKVATLHNDSMVLAPGIYVAVSKKDTFKFIIR